jgi:cellulose synthase/poly-beta-1,6-N-acetylglucosamine synthase-like glycosyltransferase
MSPDSRLACLIQEEIIDRHRTMPVRVDFLATFNVVYRRAALEHVGGFDERFLKAQDVELAYRIQAAGWRLEFDIRSRVKHYHPTRLSSYLYTQAQQGFWRACLYRKHPSRAGGDVYSGLVDHTPPVLAVLCLFLLPFMTLLPVRPAVFASCLLLTLMQVPMTARLIRRTGQGWYVLFLPLAIVRAFSRGIGMTAGALSLIRRTVP